MAFVALLIGAILIVVALNGTQGQLASELENDVPGFFKWAAAIVAILAIGYIPGLKTPVRWLLALAIVAMLLANVGGVTTNLINAFKTFGTGGGSPAGGSSSTSPTNSASSAAGVGIGQAMSQAMQGVSKFFGSAGG